MCGLAAAGAAAGAAIVAVPPQGHQTAMLQLLDVLPPVVAAGLVGRGQLRRIIKLNLQSRPQVYSSHSAVGPSAPYYLRIHQCKAVRNRTVTR
jgi:hypothetical protein